MYSSCLDAFKKTIASLEHLRRYAINHKNTLEIWVHGATLVGQYDDLDNYFKEWIVEGLTHFPENQTLKMALQSEAGKLGDHFDTENIVEQKNCIKQPSNPAVPVRTTVICAVWHKDPQRELLLRGHRENLAGQTRLVDIIYVFDGGDRPSFDLQSRTVLVSENLTIYQAWNVALSLVETPYVMNLNLDDRLNLDAVEKLEDVSMRTQPLDWLVEIGRFVLINKPLIKLINVFLVRPMIFYQIGHRPQIYQLA